MSISDWSSDVCSSDLGTIVRAQRVTIDRTFTPIMRTVTQMTNTQETKCFAPWPTWAVLSRLLHLRYLVYNAGAFIGLNDPNDPSKGPPGMIASTQPGRAIVEWQMLEGEERSEEHTSELQSLMRISYAVFCLKKKSIKIQNATQKETQ